MAPVFAVVGVITAITGGIIGAMQASQQGQAQANEANMNSKIMSQNAAAVAQQRQAQLAESQRRYNLLEGQTRAQAGAMGTAGGSTLDILSDMENQALFDRTNIVNQSVAQQQNYYNQSASYRAQASSARQAGTLGAISSILGGFGSAARIGASSGPSSSSSAGSSSGSSYSSSLYGF